MDNPALYTKTNGPQRHDVEDLSEEFIDEITRISGRCLDIGSGPGDVVADLILPKLNNEATIVCSDISDKMVNFGKEKFKDNKRMSFTQLNIESKNLSEHLVGQFDHVTSFYCIHWCQDIRQVFRNIFDLLLPGGTALVTFIANSESFKPYTSLAAMPRYQLFMKNADRYIPAFQDTERPREVLKALLKDIGFRIRHFSIRKRYFIFETMKFFSKFVLAVNPFMEQIPVELKKQYEKDLIEEVTKTCIVFNDDTSSDNDKRRVLLTYDTFVIYLEKPVIVNPSSEK